jgi:hypothetical protein
MTEHTDFAGRYDRLIGDLAADIARGSFTPESVPRIIGGLKDEIHDLVAGFRDVSTGERHPLPEPLMPMAVAKKLIARLNELLSAPKP